MTANFSLEGGGDKKKTDLSKSSQQGIDLKSKIFSTVKSVSNSVIDAVKNPKQTWISIKEICLHYWVGSKLLWSEIKITSNLLTRVAQGHSMTRRERMQLIRTSTDIFRLVPFAIFVIVPFMELLLPLALKIFPNMLPSTFQDSLKKEETMKKELQMRLAVAGFLQETLKEMAANKKRQESTDTSGAKEILEFIEKARLGEPLSNDSVIRIARSFKDELTLANAARPQLVSMCQYMGLKPYGADAFIRFQLRNKIRSIKEDDRRILWEGIDSLTVEELREACQERGMRSMGLTHFGYKRQMQDWLDLSIKKDVPISLLIMSRSFYLTSSATAMTEDVLKSSISSLTDDTINEVLLAAASPSEEQSIEMQKRKLDSLEFQNELINEEREESEEASSRKKLLKKKQQQLLQQQQQLVLDAGTVSSTVPSTVQSSAVSTSAATEVPSSKVAVSAEQQQVETTPSVHVQVEPLQQTTVVVTPEIKISEEKDLDRMLTVSDFETLGDLARGSSVVREKAELAKLQANIEAVNISIGDDHDETAVHITSTSVPARTELTTMSISTGTVSSTSIPVATPSAEAKSKDKSVRRMHAVIDSMLDKLKDRIESTEKALGDKLKVLDLDEDGELSVEELKGAISKILKRASSDAEAEEIVKLLDHDQDGKISVVELLKYIDERRDKVEVEALESQICGGSEGKPHRTEDNNNNNIGSSMNKDRYE